MYAIRVLGSEGPPVMISAPRRRSESGFTLVELLIVVLILGALASTVVVASGGFRDKGVVQACQAAIRVYRTGFEAYRADNVDGLYPTNDAQVVPKYARRTGGSSATVSGTPEAAVVRGKGWSFTISYGSLAGGASAGSDTEPSIGTLTGGCTSAGESSAPSALTCPTGQWTVKFWNITSAALPTGIPGGAPTGSLPCSAANRPSIFATGGAPLAGANPDFVVAQWTGTLSLPAGATTFTTVSDDGIRVRVAGTQVINNWTLHGDTTDSGVFTAPSAGNYEVQIDFYEWGGFWTTRLSAP